MPNSKLIRTVPVLDDLLHAHRAELGHDFTFYQGHCYRVLNYGAALVSAGEAPLHKLGIACALHDIGIWTHGTFDYLAPSIQAARNYLDTTGERHLFKEIEAMISYHHRIRPAPDGAGALVEAFRRADWADVTGGVLALGIPRHVIRAAYGMWPDAGFHRKLVQLTWSRFRDHPLSPLPMLKF